MKKWLSGGRRSFNKTTSAKVIRDKSKRVIGVSTGRKREKLSAKSARGRSERGLIR